MIYVQFMLAGELPRYRAAGQNRAQFQGVEYDPWVVWDSHFEWYAERLREWIPSRKRWIFGGSIGQRFLSVSGLPKLPGC